MRFPADRAGTAAVCASAGPPLQIPKPKAPLDDEEDTSGGYGLMEVVEEKKTLPVEPAKKKESRRSIRRCGEKRSCRMPTSGTWCAAA